MLEPQRHGVILSMLKDRQVVTVKELESELDASLATIRRDLNKLSSQGKLSKVHGGAKRIDDRVSVLRPSLKGDSFESNVGKAVTQKRAIARKAVELCHDGDSIIINGGSSTYMMTEFLVERRLNILTNSVPLALELLETSDNRVTLSGGELYREQNIVLSAFDDDAISHYHGRMMFMGTPGIGDYGVMESDPLIVRAELKLKKQADKLVVLADSTKIGARSNLIAFSLADVSVLITDKGIGKAERNAFEKAGIDVIVS